MALGFRLGCFSTISGCVGLVLTDGLVRFVNGGKDCLGRLVSLDWGAVF